MSEIHTVNEHFDNGHDEHIRRPDNYRPSYNYYNPWWDFRYRQPITIDVKTRKYGRQDDIWRAAIFGGIVIVILLKK
ncbi:MAG: hypothetical protein Faunusvirus30_3 [Faunusvirus sp.]|uniref:Uncharacterized protein n=1 Tax=Faunusvirus sp. TaxID=2487766 RepID=A0A3G4ZZ94_9VIRU|nr:MAG: hypothetical protein Faunusvirus30_3 [Faunusvirus sp.]